MLGVCVCLCVFVCLCLCVFVCLCVCLLLWAVVCIVLLCVVVRYGVRLFCVVCCGWRVMVDGGRWCVSMCVDSRRLVVCCLYVLVVGWLLCAALLLSFCGCVLLCVVC